MTSFLLLVTFSLGLGRALADTGKVSFSEGFLYLHVVFALITGVLSLALFKLAYNTGLLFPRVLAGINLIFIAIASLSGLSVLLTSDDAFATIMLYSFEVSFGVSSVLIGYLYCFYHYLSGRC